MIVRRPSGTPGEPIIEEWTPEEDLADRRPPPTMTVRASGLSARVEDEAGETDDGDGDGEE